MSLLIQKEGIFTSLQDLGFYGAQRFGINPRGAMDRTAVRIANILAGNDDGRKVLEFYFPAPEIIFQADCRIALAGADLDAELDGQTLALGRSTNANAGSTLRFISRNRGGIGYLAAGGGLVTPGSKGGEDIESSYPTRRLTKGEVVGIGTSSALGPIPIGRIQASHTLLEAWAPGPTVRILPGAEFEYLTAAGKRILQSSQFTISVDSNRMGFRLIGPQLASNRRTELVSAAVTFGTIQLLPDGQMIILMAEHQTSGGYPRIGHVISTDLPCVAQLGPNEKLRFRMSTIKAAETARGELEHSLQLLRIGVNLASAV